MKLTAEDKERLASAKLFLGQRDYGACIETFNEFAQRGDIASAAALGEIYFRGGRGVVRDYSKARYWLEKVDNFVFSPPAVYKLGLIYYKGLGVKVDYNKAYILFRKLALKRSPHGLVMVGLMHKDQEGVLFKPRLAQTCFRAAFKSNGLNFVERCSVGWMILANCGNAIRGTRQASLTPM